MLSIVTRLLQGARTAIRSRLGRPTVASVPGGGKTLAALGALVITAVLVLTPFGRGLLFDLLGRTPGVRDLPGVEAVIGVPAPDYRSAIFDLQAPLSVAVSPEGDVLYVAEGKGERTVRRIPLNGSDAWTDLHPPGTTAGTRKPVSVAVGEGGIVYVVDRVRGEVDMYDGEGTWLGLLIPAGPPAEWWPLAVDTGPGGEVFVLNSQTAGAQLAEYAPSGELVEVVPVLTAAVVEAAVELGFPSGAALLNTETLVLADSNNGRVLLLDRESATVMTIGSGVGEEQFGMPRGLAVDRRGHLLVVDVVDHSVSAWDMEADSPRFLYRFGGQGFADGEFLFPNDVAVDRSGNIYVADRDNDRIQIWR